MSEPRERNYSVLGTLPHDTTVLGIAFHGDVVVIATDEGVYISEKDQPIRRLKFSERAIDAIR